MTGWRLPGLRWQTAAGVGLLLLVAGAAAIIASRPRAVPTEVGSESDECSALLLAAQGDSLDEVRALLDEGTSPNTKDRLGWTALHWAAYHGNEKLVRLLLDRGADINARTASEFDPPDAGSSVSDECPLKTPLFAAAAGGRLEIVRLLLDQGADLKLNDPWYGTALHRAAAEGETQVAKLLLERGADPDARTQGGETPLHWAVWHHGRQHWRMRGLWDNVPVKTGPVDAVPMITLLLAHGADTDLRDEKGWTPLHSAGYEGHAGVSKALVEQGSDPTLRITEPHVIRTPHIRTQKGASGQTVLHLAATSGDLALVKVAISRGTKLDVTDDLGDTPLHEASRAGQSKVAAYLVSRGASANAVDGHGLTPLHLAAYSGTAETLRLLLDHGADPNVRTTRPRELPRLKDRPYGPDVPVGQTPLHLAAVWGPPEAVQELIGRGARVNVGDGKGSTPLHLAVNGNRPTVAKALLEHGADVNAQDNKGWAPLHDAANQGLAKLPGILLDHGADCTLRDASEKTPLDYARPGSPLRALLRERES